MNHYRLQLIFFFLFILAVIALNFFIFLPYLSILFLALVFAILFDPLYRYMLKACNGKASFAALLSVFIVFLVILGPLSFFATLLVQEVSDLYVSLLSANGAAGFHASFEALKAGMAPYLPNVNLEALEGDLEVYLTSGLSWFMSHISVLFSGILKVGFGLVVMLLALFYFFRDGKKFVSSLVELSPLSDAYDRKIVERIVVAVNSVVRGHLVIAVIQGTLTGIGFALFGVGGPVIWGTIAAVASLVPTLGVGLVIIPGVIMAFFASGPIFALGLALWGIIAVGLVDNILGPILINRGVHIHPFLILISALGALSLFGPIGFLAGPVILSLLFALLDIYPVVVTGRVRRSASRSKSRRPL